MDPSTCRRRRPLLCVELALELLLLLFHRLLQLRELLLGLLHLLRPACGSATSSEMGFDWMAFNSGDWGGLLLSHDNGHTWSMTAFPPNMFITAIVLLSNESFLVSVRASFHDRDAGGVWRTTDAGATWTRTLDKPVYDLVAVPCVCRSLRPTAPLHPSSFHIPPRPASAPSLTQGIRSLA